jgi:hypothetical protein
MPPLDTQVHVCATLQEARIIRDKLPPSHPGFFIVDAGGVRTRDGDTVGSIMAKVPIEVWTALGVDTRNSWNTEAREDVTRGEMDPADDATTDDEGGRGSAKAGSSKGKTKVKAKAKDKDYKGKEAQVGGAFGSSSRPKSAATVNAKYTDDDDDFEVGAGGDVSDEY